MIEIINTNDETVINALCKLGGHFKENPKIGGEYTETFLVQTFNKFGVKSNKVAGRKKADIQINGIDYSVKSSSLNGAQIDTLSDGQITIKQIVELGGEQLVTDEKHSVKLSNKSKVLDLICNSLDSMPIIFAICKNENDKVSFDLAELSAEELKYHIKNVDSIYYKRPKRRNCIQLIKNNKVLFTIKDGTGTTAANAFQRGLWATNLSFIKSHINIKNIPIKEISFYDN